jgi:hypothetical protein
MSSFRKSLFVLAGLIALVVGLVALFAPASTRGQGQGGPPDTAARHPFQASVNVSTLGGANGTAQITVPAGTRLVIEHVSAESRSPITPAPLRFDVKTTVGGSTATHYLVSVAQGDQGFPIGITLYRVSQSVRLYADPPAVEVHLDVPLGGPPTPGPLPATGSVTVSGYLVDVP